MKKLVMNKQQARDLSVMLKDSIAPKDFSGTLDELYLVTKSARDIKNQLIKDGYYKLLDEVSKKNEEHLAPAKKELDARKDAISAESDEEKKQVLIASLQTYVGEMNKKYEPIIKKNEAKLSEENEKDVDILLSNDKFEATAKFFEEHAKTLLTSMEAVCDYKDIFSAVVDLED